MTKKKRLSQRVPVSARTSLQMKPVITSAPKAWVYACANYSEITAQRYLVHVCQYYRSKHSERLKAVTNEKIVITAESSFEIKSKRRKSPS